MEANDYVDIPMNSGQAAEVYDILVKRIEELTDLAERLIVGTNNRRAGFNLIDRTRDMQELVAAIETPFEFDE